MRLKGYIYAIQKKVGKLERVGEIGLRMGHTGLNTTTLHPISKHPSGMCEKCTRHCGTCDYKL